MSSTSLNFGDVIAPADKEMAVDFTNTTSSDLVVSSVNLYHTAYSYSLNSTTIAPGSSVKLRVKFAPIHNIKHNSECIVVLSDGSEHRIDLNGNGRYAGTYYSSTFDKSYQALKSELTSIISSGTVSLGYNTARDNMYATIDNNGGTVTCAYTGKTANFTTRSGANSNSFNCEHTWPQSKFNSNEPERSDIHHLFPTDVNANSRRSNYPFRVVSSASWEEGGSKLGSGTFEPRDVQKGRTARAMMYFLLRHGNAGSFMTTTDENVLVGWHNAYDPSTAEEARNEAIFALQRNRNPFVDHPEFMDRINNLVSNDPTPVDKETDIAQSVINYGSVTASDVRMVYVTNKGNQNMPSIDNATTNGNVLITATDNGAGAGESGAITLGFATGLADGNYKDTLSFSVHSGARQYIVPISFTIGVSSVDDVAVKYPTITYDPSQQQFRLLGDVNDVLDVKIYSLNGSVMIFNDINSSFTDIPFQGNAHGVYFVEIRTSMGSQTSKVLVY